jgi:hypothetical protein
VLNRHQLSACKWQGLFFHCLLVVVNWKVLLLACYVKQGGS